MERLTNLIRSIDIYGYPVSLSINGERKYKSLIGGIFTLIGTTIILSYIMVSVL